MEGGHAEPTPSTAAQQGSADAEHGVATAGPGGNSFRRWAGRLHVSSFEREMVNFTAYGPLNSPSMLGGYTQDSPGWQGLEAHLMGGDSLFPSPLGLPSLGTEGQPLPPWAGFTEPSLSPLGRAGSTWAQEASAPSAPTGGPLEDLPPHALHALAAARASMDAAAAAAATSGTLSGLVDGIISPPATAATTRRPSGATLDASTPGVGQITEALSHHYLEDDTGHERQQQQPQQQQPPPQQQLQDQAHQPHGGNLQPHSHLTAADAFTLLGGGPAAAKFTDSMAGDIAAAAVMGVDFTSQLQAAGGMRIGGVAPPVALVARPPLSAMQKRQRSVREQVTFEEYESQYGTAAKCTSGPCAQHVITPCRLHTCKCCKKHRRLEGTQGARNKGYCGKCARREKVEGLEFVRCCFVSEVDGVETRCGVEMLKEVFDNHWKQHRNDAPPAFEDVETDEGRSCRACTNMRPITFYPQMDTNCSCNHCQVVKSKSSKTAAATNGATNGTPVSNGAGIPRRSSVDRISFDGMTAAGQACPSSAPAGQSYSRSHSSPMAVPPGGGLATANHAATTEADASTADPQAAGSAPGADAYAASAFRRAITSPGNVPLAEVLQGLGGAASFPAGTTGMPQTPGLASSAPAGEFSPITRLPDASPLARMSDTSPLMARASHAGSFAGPAGGGAASGSGLLSDTPALRRLSSCAPPISPLLTEEQLATQALAHLGQAQQALGMAYAHCNTLARRLAERGVLYQVNQNNPLMQRLLSMCQEIGQDVQTVAGTAQGAFPA